ncbi:uncharacterized protein TNCV_617591 [Trichonephila clavipes]|nr:uncharacterized protein TNCV_617591 [Trichonephila clavipes]
MTNGASVFLGFCIIMVQMLQLNCQPPIDPEVRAQLEAKVISSMSMKELEEMVEKDERVLNIPKSKLIILPKPKNGDGIYGPEEMDQKAYIIQRKAKKYPKKAPYERFGYGLTEREVDDGFRRLSYEPKVFLESAFRFDEKFPSLFGISDMEAAGSNPVKQFYESIVEKVVSENKNQYSSDPLALLEVAASEDIPAYSPRFSYDAYSKDSTETKLKGKPYWKDAPERREENVDEKGCRTVVKKVMDPEDEKKSGNAEAKSVIITKECEYPNVDGPDAKLAEMQSNLRASGASLESQPSVNYDSEVPSYASTRPLELEMESKSSDALAPDYIDRMLETHFKSFPTFSNPITSFKGYQERFNLRTPSGFKDIKPTINVHSYEYSNPESGFEKENERASFSDKKELKNESPVTYERQQQYEREDNTPRKLEPSYAKPSPKVYEHHYHYDYPEKSPRKAQTEDYDEQKDSQGDSKYSEKKDPKMVKKSFAYYRKDNPKQDPNDQQYAEEYAQGSYRSFSSDYDSERDGPKKD